MVSRWIGSSRSGEVQCALPEVVVCFDDDDAGDDGLFRRLRWIESLELFEAVRQPGVKECKLI